MNSQESDYEQRLKQARAQGDGNPYTSGIQPVVNKVPAPETVPTPPSPPEQNSVGTDKLDQRLALYAKAAGNADFGNNDRSETMRIA
ncbi:MAG: hypothetical protein CMA50_02195 [Euryarchaeota archaeon]|nr:hypothetical protein [Euryarchaeota archaeon]